MQQFDAGNSTMSRLGTDSFKEIDQLGKLAPFLLQRPALQCILDAAMRVYFQDHILDLGKRSFDRLDLVHDFNAIALIFYHSDEAPHLTLDALQAVGDGGTILSFH